MYIGKFATTRESVTLNFGYTLGNIKACQGEVRFRRFGSASRQGKFYECFLRYCGNAL